MSIKSKNELANNEQYLGELKLFFDSKRDGCFVVDDENYDNNSYCREIGMSDTDMFLQHLHVKMFGKLMSAPELKKLNAYLVYLTKTSGNADTVNIHVVKKGETIYVDSADDWFIKINAKGAFVVNMVPEKFALLGTAVKMKVPDFDNPNLKLITKYIKVNPAQLKLILTFVFNCFFTDTHYKMLLLLGAAGSGKTFVQRVLKTIVDPSVTMTRTEVGKKDLIIAATNSHLIDCNNLSKLPVNTQNLLCCILTGGTAAGRTLYSNRGETAIHLHSPIIANGIADIISQDDLLERTMVIQLKKLADSNVSFVPESQLWREFERDLPKIMAGLFNALSRILREYETFVPPKELTRMADFNVLGLVAEKALGWPAGSFTEAYSANISASHDDLLENSPIAQALIRMKELGSCEFDGSYILLRDKICQYVDLGDIEPRKVSEDLIRLSAALLSLHNIKITRLNRTGGGSRVKISAI